VEITVMGQMSHCSKVIGSLCWGHLGSIANFDKQAGLILLPV